MATITELQKKVVKALETGQDPAPILKELADVRASIVMEADKEEAQKIADRRNALRKRAEGVIATVARQATAIDEFLAYRDKTLPQLQELIEPVQELARMGRASWEKDPGECYIYNDSGLFQGAVRDIPKELLPDNFKCPTLEMAISTERSFGKANEALYYLEWCIGILSNFRKGFMTPSAASTDDSLLLDNETTEANCLVCDHEAVEAINKGLKEGRSLRDLEAEFHVSRSSLGRHKNRCRNLGAIHIAE